jgi:hypothetical protein
VVMNYVGFDLINALVVKLVMNLVNFNLMNCSSGKIGVELC